MLLVGLFSMSLKKWRHESELIELALELRIKTREKLGTEMRVSFLWGSLGGREGAGDRVCSLELPGTLHRAARFIFDTSPLC